MPPLDTVFRFLLEVAALGCIIAILLWMFSLVEAKVAEPFKQVVGWAKLFMLLFCGILAIYMICDLAGISTRIAIR